MIATYLSSPLSIRLRVTRFTQPRDSQWLIVVMMMRFDTADLTTPLTTRRLC
jgi:hypothetical protein